MKRQIVTCRKNNYKIVVLDILQLKTAQQMMDQCLGHLSVRLAGDVSVDDHFFKIRPEDINPRSQSQRDAHRSLQTVLHGILAPDSSIRVHGGGQNVFITSCSHSFGCNEMALNTNYLSERCIFYFSLFSTDKGVPQGSIFAPPIFFKFL